MILLLFIVRRLLALVPVGLGVVLVVSMLIHLVPGDPADVALGPYATESERIAYKKALGLDRSWQEQLLGFYGKILQGDLGQSMVYHKPVLSLIVSRVAATVSLAVCAMGVALSLSIPLGVISALRQGKFTDYFAMGFSLLGIAIPSFWLGPMLVLLFSLELAWLPVSERGGWDTYVLPSISLGLALAAMLSRMTRNSMLDHLKEDYVRTARAKGTREPVVILKHVLRNAALPLVTVIGLQFGVLLTGAIITERIFDWPGLGSLILDGINNRDYPVVQGCVLVFSFTYLVVNLLTDLAYAFVDPRIRTARS